MAASRQRTRTPSTIADADPAATLATVCPDIGQWPQRWRADDHDLLLGRELVRCFTSFLLNLIVRGYARKTLARHRDNLWLLGGEVIRHRREEPALHREAAEHAVLQLIDEEGGPMLWPPLSDGEQITFDATCRKLYQFLAA